MAKAVKLADIAKPLGVSVVTVSKALSGQKGVSDEMRAKIVELADKLGYVQPSAARRTTSAASARPIPRWVTSCQSGLVQREMKSMWLMSPLAPAR